MIEKASMMRFVAPVAVMLAVGMFVSAFVMNPLSATVCTGADSDVCVMCVNDFADKH